MDRRVGRKRGGKRGDKLFRERAERIPDGGVADTRAGLWLPLLDTEVLSCDIHSSWRYLFPDGSKDAADW